jgi:hypothetical protein
VATSLDNLTADDDDGGEVIDVPARVVSVALVPMETGLRAYDPPNGEKPQDVRALEAKVAALRFVKEFPQADSEDIATLIATFRLDCQIEDCRHPYGDERPVGCTESPCPDDDAGDDVFDLWMSRRPEASLRVFVERFAEKEYDRVHQGEDWPEVAERKARIRAADAIAAAERSALIDQIEAERPTMPRADAETAAEPHDDEPRPEAHEPEPVASGAGYSRRYRALVESTLRRIEACAELDGLAVLVARVMLDRADANSRETWQSAATIARRAHVNEDTARDRIGALRRAHIIEVAKQGGRGPGNATRYRFPISNYQTSEGK